MTAITATVFAGVNHKTEKLCQAGRKCGQKPWSCRPGRMSAEPSIGLLVTGVIVFVLAAILLVTFARPDWLPEWIPLENAVLMSSIGVLGVMLFALLLRIHDVTSVHHELLKTRELAALREHERDLAQRGLMTRLESERGLEREKAQFQAQLSDYRRSRRLRNLHGRAHEINSPLLGIMSHLELDVKDAKDEERRLEIEGCIEGARRISSAVRGLLNYARPGPLLINHINLDNLVATPCTSSIISRCSQHPVRKRFSGGHAPNQRGCKRVIAGTDEPASECARRCLKAA